MKNYAPVDPKQFFHIHCSVCVHVGGFTGNWCAALWISLARVLVSGSGFPVICLLISLFSLFPCLCLPASVSPDVSLYLSAFICFLLFSPFWVVLSGSPGVFFYVSSFMYFPLWLVVSTCSDIFSLLSFGCHHSSRFICLPIHLSSVPSLPCSGGV